MKLIVGLGNVGDKYTQTRHNAGFLALELIAIKMGYVWDSAWGGLGEVAKDNNRNIWLFKPGLFMNRSGEALDKLVNYYKLDEQGYELGVINDDLDLLLGEIRETKGGGAAGHNGVASLQAIVGEKWENVTRWRLGIGRPAVGVTDPEVISNWVLSQVGVEGREVWGEMLNKCAQVVIEKFIK